jgi:short-subunit dehydrogenase
LKTVWITGASSGIGEALAKAYAGPDTRLVLSSRRQDELERVGTICKSRGSEIHIQTIDLGDEESIRQAAAEVLDQVGRIDLLINNGGISQRSKAIDTPIELDRKLFEINYFGSVLLTKLVLPGMVEAQSGHIVAISSISGKFGFHLRSAYAATKHALFGFFETIGLEHYSDNIYTTIVCPGRIQTNISKHALDKDGKASGTMDKGLAEGMDVDVCAAKIKRGIDRKKREVLVGKKELLLVYIHKYFPRLFWKIAPGIDPR